MNESSLTVNNECTKKSFFNPWLNGYLKNYSGLDAPCWKRVFLTFINDISGGICFYLSLYFVNVLNFSLSQAGFIISFFGLGTTFGGIFGGKIADRISPEIVSVL